jgi:hypothetical protein
MRDAKPKSGNRALPAAALWLALALGLTLPAGAESVFAREGIGEWIEGYDLRGEALGSTGIGVLDLHNFTGPNPATTAFSRKSMGFVGIGTTVRWADDGRARHRRPSTYLTGLGGHVALGTRFGIRFAMGPATDAAYSLETNVATGWEGIEEDVRREEGSRGLLRYALAVTWRGGRNWALAAGGGLLAGSLIDETSYAFGDSAVADGWIAGEDQRRLRFRPAPFFIGGLLARPLPAVTVGGFVSTGAEADVSGSYESFAGNDWDRDESRVRLPLGAGCGAALQVGDRLRLSGDLIWREWEETTLDDLALPLEGVGPFRNTLRWGVGLERLPSSDPRASTFATISWRIGFAAIPWYLVDADGDGIDEWRVSCGVGLPVQRDRGTVDFLLAYGRRGSRATNGIEEEYVRFGFGSIFSSMPREY